MGKKAREIRIDGMTNPEKGSVEHIFGNFIREQIKSWGEGSVPVEIIIREIPRDRSVRQNNWYWLIINKYIKPALRMMGYNVITDRDADKWVCATYLKDTIVNKKTGEVTDVQRSTSDLDFEEMGHLLETLQVDFSEFGYPIPDPIKSKGKPISSNKINRSNV